MGFDTVYLPSAAVNVPDLLDSIASVGWKIEELEALVAFGSSTRVKKVSKEVGHKYKHFWTRKWKYKKVKVDEFIKPNDIDILALFTTGGDQKQESVVSKDTEIEYQYLNGYVGWVFRESTRESRYHLFKYAKESFLQDIDALDDSALTIVKEGYLLWGECSVINKFPTRIIDSNHPVAHFTN